MKPILEMRGITKMYGKAAAVQDVNFNLMKGEVHAILGENGAGKSTLTKMMAGVVQPTSGNIMFEGAPITIKSPAEAVKFGIAMVFQETSLVPSMTVAQNLFLGNNLCNP